MRGVAHLPLFFNPLAEKSLLIDKITKTEDAGMRNTFYSHGGLYIVGGTSSLFNKDTSL